MKNNIEYSNNKGELWKDDHGVYHWTSKETGNVLSGYNHLDRYAHYDIVETVLNFNPCLSKFNTGWYYGWNTSILTIKTEDITLAGSKYNGSWEEVNTKLLNDGSVLYTGDIGLAIIIDNNGKITDVANILTNIAEYGMKNTLISIPECLYNMTWLEGFANWQGAPISENQAFKLKLLGLWNKEPYINYRAARLDDLNLNVYVKEDPIGDIYYIYKCDGEHKFYVNNEET